MIEVEFWQEAKAVWVKPAQSHGTVMTGMGGSIDPRLAKAPWESKTDEEAMEIDIDDFDKIYHAIKNGENLTADSLKKRRFMLDQSAFRNVMEKESVSGYMEAAKMLMKCDLPEEIMVLYNKLTENLNLLQNVNQKFESLYKADFSQLYEYYIPEALNLTASYLEYLDLGMDEETIKDTEQEMKEVLNQLNIAVSNKSDEIYKFASMELKAKAKALETMMGQAGNLDTDQKL